MRLWPYLDELARKAWERLPSDDPRRQAVNAAAGELIRVLSDACRELPSSAPTPSTTAPSGVQADEGNWEQFARMELVDMMGRPHVRSVTDLLLKATSVLRALGPDRHFLFRGQRDIRWALQPKFGRVLNLRGWSPPATHLDGRNLTFVLPEELDALSSFRSRWPVEDLDPNDDRAISDDSAEWWFRMQHYDATSGTRLLDLTTSPLAALLFACVDWETGLVDRAADGVVYLWSEGFNANVDDFIQHELPTSAADLFTGKSDAPRMILNPAPNERSKAQSGAFLWWPRFWIPLANTQLFYLRVPSEAKEEIVRDLLAMGFGPKEAVRGRKGLANEQRLRSSLGLPAFDPLVLRASPGT